jgi:hypothetical protein
MALDLKLEICQSTDCKTLTITDATGVYSPSNPGGYGNPNVEASEITSAILTVTISSTTTTDIETFSFDVIDSFPDPTGEVEYDVTSYLLGFGYDVSIPDNLYSFTLEVTGTDSEDEQFAYAVTVDKLLYCIFKCFVFQELANLIIKEVDCCKDDGAMDEFFKHWVYYESLKHSSECGDIVQYNHVLDIVKKVQGVEDCGCH